MPEGVVEWFDTRNGEAAVAKAGRSYRVAADELEPAARHPGAHVHFDIETDGEGVERAVHVSLHRRIRGSRREHRLELIRNVEGVDTSNAESFAIAHPETGLSPLSHPLEVAHAWARCLAMSHLDEALLLYAPGAALHVDGRTISDLPHLQNYFEASPLLGIGRDPVIRSDGETVHLRWEEIGGEPGGIDVHCRVVRGQLTEQWIGVAPPEPEPIELMELIMTGPLQMTVVTHHVGDFARADAIERVGAVIGQIDDPVLFTRMKLTHVTDPARERPAIAQLTVDVNGELIRVHVAAATMREAIDKLVRRLRDKFEHRAQHRKSLRQRTATRESGEWRHGDLPTARPDYFDRPVGERQVVRHKTYAVDEITPDEAVFDMEQLDFDFYLFRDLAAGEDAVVERRPDGSYLMTRLHPSAIDPRPTAVAIAVATHPTPELSVDDAVERLGSDERFVFFANATTGRGNVVYHRYDGHYGLITLE